MHAWTEIHLICAAILKEVFMAFLFFSFFFRSIQHAGFSVCRSLKPNMKPQLFAIDLILLCISCGASALATSIPALSTSNFTNPGAARSYGTDAAALSKSRRKRYISQNDMLAILDYHNKVRGKVFPPASNMEYMVSESFHSNFVHFHQEARLFPVNVWYSWNHVPNCMHQVKWWRMIAWFYQM